MPKIKNIISNQPRPILVEFQNGQIQTEYCDILKSKLFENEENKQRILGINTGKRIYVGETKPDGPFNHYLVHYKEGDKKLDLVKIDTCLLAPFNKKKKPLLNVSFLTQTVADLNKQFGSKKTKKYTEQQERLAANVENVKEHLQKTLQNIDITDAKNIPDTCPESVYLPKINRNATNRVDVYCLSDLVPIDVLNSLEGRATEILSSEDTKSFKLIHVIENLLQQLKILSLPQNDLMERMKVLIYVHYLLSFINTPMAKVNKQFVACDCSIKVNKHIKENYMINGTRPLSIKDKAICYSLTLLMLVMDYQVDLEPISKDIRVSLTKLKTLAKNLGFTQSYDSKSTVLLKIPLHAPVSFNLKRKRK